MSKDTSSLMKYIYRLESDSNYDAWHSKTKLKPDTPLTSMTVSQVLEWQKRNAKLPKGQAYSAAGALQIIHKTLLDQVGKGTVKLTDKFDAKTQDKLTLKLMEQRGLSAWQAGRISTEDFGTNLAKEWAALPVLKDTYRGKNPVRSGSSYYSGVAGNKAGDSIRGFKSALTSMGERPFALIRDELEGAQQITTEPPDIPDYNEPVIRGGSDVSLSGGFGAAFGREFSDGFLYKQIAHSFQQSGHYENPDFNAHLAAAKDGYSGKTLKYLGRAVNAEHYAELKGNVARELKADRLRMRDGDGFAKFLGGVANPDSMLMMTVPIGMGASILKSGASNALRAGTASAAAVLPIELAMEARRSKLDPTVTTSESIMRVGAATVMSGLFGAGIGAYAGMNGKKAVADRMARELAPRAANTSSVKIKDQDVKIVMNQKLPDDARDILKQRGAVVFDGKLHIDDATILNRYNGDPNLRERFESPNELLEYEIAHAAKLHEGGVTDVKMSEVDELPFEASAKDWAAKVRSNIEEKADVLRQADEAAMKAAEVYRRKNNKILQDRRLQILARMADSPRKIIHRNALSDQTRDLDNLLEDDGGFLMSSMKLGKTEGPSVEASIRVWDGRLSDVVEAETELYSKYAGKDRGGSIGGVSIAKTLGAGKGKLSIEEFRHEVSLAMISGQKNTIPEVMEMVEVLRETLEMYKTAMKRTGILNSKTSMEKKKAALDRLQVQKKRAQKLKTPKAIKKAAKIQDEIQEEIDLLDELIAQSEGEPDFDYYTRIWSNHAIEENKEFFRDNVVIPYMRENPIIEIWVQGQDEFAEMIEIGKRRLKYQPKNDLLRSEIEKLQSKMEDAPPRGRYRIIKAPTDPKSLKKRADEIIEDILGESDPANLALSVEASNPRFSKRRQLNIPNDRLLKDGPMGNRKVDFISTDYATNLQLYNYRVAPAIEMARKFGRPEDGLSWRQGFKRVLEQAKAAEMARWEGRTSLPKHMAKVELGPIGKRSNAAAFYNLKTNTVHVDKEAILGMYDAKPWLTPKKPGVRPLPSDVIKSEADWLNFVLTHEILHSKFRPEKLSLPISGKYNPKDKSHVAAYENEINDMAVQHLRDEVDLALTPEAKKRLPKTFDEHWDRLELQFLHTVDRITHSVNKNPDRWDNRAATAMRSLAQTALMGASVLPAMQDIGNVIMRWGMSKVFRSSFHDLDSSMGQVIKAARSEMGSAGAKMDVIRATAVSGVAEAGFDAGVVTKLERGLRVVANKFFLLNGLSPLTIALKNIDAGIRVPDMLDRIMRAGQGKATAEDITYMARHGISHERAKLMSAQPIDGSEGMFFANTKAWTDEDLVHEFRAAIAMGNNNTILAATFADKPKIIDGAVYLKQRPELQSIAEKYEWEKVGKYYKLQSGLLTLPFTFWNYALAATNKIMLSTLDEPSKQKMAGIAAIMGIAYMVQQIKTDPYVWENMPFHEKMRNVVDGSGIAGVLGQYMNLSQDTSLGLMKFNPYPFDPKHGHESTASEAITGLAGAGPSTVRNLLEGAVTGDISQFSWGLPFRNHLLFKSMIDHMVDGLEGLVEASG